MAMVGRRMRSESVIGRRPKTVSTRPLGVGVVPWNPLDVQSVPEPPMMRTYSDSDFERNKRSCSVRMSRLLREAGATAIDACRNVCRHAPPCQDGLIDVGRGHDIDGTERVDADFEVMPRSLPSIRPSCSGISG